MRTKDYLVVGLPQKIELRPIGDEIPWRRSCRHCQGSAPRDHAGAAGGFHDDQEDNRRRRHVHVRFDGSAARRWWLGASRPTSLRELRHYGTDQCASSSAWKLVSPESNDPVIAIAASTPRGKSTLVIEAMKIAAVGSAMTK